MRKTDVITIGGGQAGLAMSRSLALRNIDHVVLERGRIGERWHSERWRSLRLLTTSAMSVLPGLPHDGDDRDAFMPAWAFAAYLDRYARTMNSPIMNGVEVTEVEPAVAGYRVSTTAGEWRSRAVVVATGACETPFRPAMAQALATSILQLSPTDYWEPDQLPEGGVLVIGASSTGAQLAEEIHESGRPVTLAVGDHTRVPRRYRGRDIYAWMETAGILDDPALEGGNLDAARRQPSLQLVGRPDNRDLDLGVLVRLGVRLVGRLTAIDGGIAKFAEDFDRTTKASHVRMLRILDRIDGCIGDRELEALVADPAVRIPVLAGLTGFWPYAHRCRGRALPPISVWATGRKKERPAIVSARTTAHIAFAGRRLFRRFAAPLDLVTCQFGWTANGGQDGALDAIE